MNCYVKCFEGKYICSAFANDVRNRFKSDMDACEYAYNDTSQGNG